MTVGPFCTKVSCLLCHWASHYILCLILLVHPMEALFWIKNSNTFTKILNSYRIIYRVSWKAYYWWSTAAYKTSYPCLCSLQVGFCLTAPFKHMCLSHHQPWLMLKVIETLAYYVKDIDLHLQAEWSVEAQGMKLIYYTGWSWGGVQACEPFHSPHPPEPLNSQDLIVNSPL